MPTYCRDNPKMVGDGGLIDCCQGLGFSRLTHPTLMHIFSCFTALGGGLMAVAL